MDFTMKQWIVGSILIVIVVIVIDGIRRMRNARRDSLHMSLKVKNGTELNVEDENYGSEFPNGGARPSQKTINKHRIGQVKSQYNYGRDLSITTDEAGSNIYSEPTVESASQYQTSESKENISTDQWVDGDEHDEEYYETYYAEKWDDEPINTLNDDDLADEKFDSVALGDGNLDDDDYTDSRNVDNNRVALLEEKEELLVDHPTGISEGGVKEPAQETMLEEPSQIVRKEYEENKSAYQQPEQVPLNLEESVPVLMESVTAEDANGQESVDTVESEGEIEDSVDVDTVDSVPVKHPQKEKKSANIRSVGKTVKPKAESSDDDDENLDTHSANKPRYKSKYFSKKPSSTSEVSAPTLQEVLVVNVKASKGSLFNGIDLLQQVLDNGLRYGAMEVFHRHADEGGEGPIIFSMANMLKPGTFDLKTIDEFTTAGVTLFLTLPVFNDNNMAAFDLMIATAKNLAENLGGELNDENRSVMTGQTIEHYRERIRDFSRRQQLEKKR